MAQESRNLLERLQLFAAPPEARAMVHLNVKFSGPMSDVWRDTKTILESRDTDLIKEAVRLRAFLASHEARGIPVEFSVDGKEVDVYALL